MKIYNFLAARRKAIVPFIIGALGIVLLYLQLNSDGSISNADWQLIIGAIVAWLTTTLGVHQATNSGVTQ